MNGKLKFTFNEFNGGHTGYVDKLTSLDNGYLASSADDETIKIWDITNGKLKYTFDKSNGHSGLYTNLISLENGYLASRSSSIVKIWDTKNGRVKFSFDSCITYDFAKIENGYFACVSNGAKIKIWDLTNGNLKYSIDSSNDINYIIYSLISLDNGLLLSKSLTEIKIWGI